MEDKKVGRKMKEVNVVHCGSPAGLAGVGEGGQGTLLNQVTQEIQKTNFIMQACEIN